MFRHIGWGLPIRGLVMCVALCAAIHAPSAVSEGQQIDWERARRLLQNQRAGQELSEQERAYLERAREARRLRQDRGRRPGRPDLEPRASIGLTPLTQMGADERYRSQEGGLYGEGRNAPPRAHLDAALAEAARIQPLDAQGRPDPDGKIALISVGMSNTTQEFRTFMELARGDAEVSPRLVLVDGAQGGMEAFDWAHPEQRFRRDGPDPWDVLMRRLEAANISPPQVQAAWIKQARRSPGSIGRFPAHAEDLKENLAIIVRKLRDRFPNLHLAYLSSRIYAGYATTPLNPEPYAYESAFSVRWLIRDQIGGAAALNHDESRGPVEAPLLLWGPYLWADGVAGRASDGLRWEREDFAGDGTHPSPSGRRKVAERLLRFFKTDPTTVSWFRRP